VLDDIISLIKTISDDDRDALWRAFVDSYDYNAPPKRATFKKLMYKDGIREKQEKTYYMYCKACQAGYPTDIKTCYYCGKELKMHVGELPVKYIEMWRYCEMCEKFAPGIQGAVCKYYGSNSFAWGLSRDAIKEQLTICKTCPCRLCCTEEKVFRGNYREYQDMAARGEFRGPAGFERKKEV
jgi:hypothetical protein